MTRHFAVAIALAVVAPAAASPILWPGLIENVSQTPSLMDVDPDINSRGHVVWSGPWEDGSPWETWYYDGRTVTNLSDMPNEVDDYPLICDSGLVAWTHHQAGSQRELYTWDGATKTNLRLMSYLGELDGNDIGQLVWSEYITREVYFWDGSTITNISNDLPTQDRYPQVNNVGQMVWCSAGDVVFWDGSTPTNLSQTSGFTEDMFDINDSGHVIWASPGGVAALPEIWLWDGVTTTRLTESETALDLNPRINNNGQATWEGNGIWYYDGATATRISGNTWPGNTNPRINEAGQVVWVGWDSATGSDYDIFFYDGRDRVYVLTDNTADDSSVEISGSWITWVGADGEIYRTHVPEPGTFALLGLGLMGLLMLRRRRGGA